jgi:hypothetical protein
MARRGASSVGCWSPSNVEFEGLRKMSGTFDPEDVELWFGAEDGVFGKKYKPASGARREQCLVSAADYDRLLGLYRLQKSNLAAAMATIEAIKRECPIDCASRPNVRNATESLLSLVPSKRAK